MKTIRKKVGRTKRLSDQFFPERSTVVVSSKEQIANENEQRERNRNIQLAHRLTIQRLGDDIGPTTEEDDVLAGCTEATRKRRRGSSSSTREGKPRVQFSTESPVLVDTGSKGGICWRWKAIVRNLTLFCC